MAAGLVACAPLACGELTGSTALPGGSRLAVVWRTLLFLPGGVDVEQQSAEAYVIALRSAFVAPVVAVVWATMADLTAYHERNGWIPALLAADPAGNERAPEAGCTSLQVGVEAVLDVQTLLHRGRAPLQRAPLRLAHAARRSWWCPTPVTSAPRRAPPSSPRSARSG